MFFKLATIIDVAYGKHLFFRHIYCTYHILTRNNSSARITCKKEEYKHLHVTFKYRNKLVCERVNVLKCV